jgi:hypothetical protein
MPFEPHKSLVACITNIRWRLPACDQLLRTTGGPGQHQSDGLRHLKVRQVRARLASGLGSFRLTATVGAIPNHDRHYTTFPYPPLDPTREWFS